MASWEIETEPEFDRFFAKLPAYKQAVLQAAIEQVLAVHGTDVCGSDWDPDTHRVYDAASTVFEREQQELARLGADLRTARRQRNLSQIELAAASGIQQAEISRIERGVGNPTQTTLIRLTNALDVRLAITDRALAR